MKYLPASVEVWGVPEKYYEGNTIVGWQLFRRKLMEYHSGKVWNAVMHTVKADYELVEECIAKWNDEGNEFARGNCAFYIFSEPIDGHVGFIFTISDVQER